MRKQKSKRAELEHAQYWPAHMTAAEYTDGLERALATGLAELAMGGAAEAVRADKIEVAPEYVEQLKAELTAAKQGLQRLKAEHAELLELASVHTPVSKAEEGELEQLKVEHSTAIEKPKAAEGELGKLKIEAAVASETEGEELEKLKAGHDTELERLKAEHGTAMKKSQAELASAKDGEQRLKAEHEAALEKIKAEHGAAIEKLLTDELDAADEQLKALQAKHATALAEKKAEHEAAVVKLQAEQFMALSPSKDASKATDPVSNLCQRFPDFKREEVLDALQHEHGHAGHAAIRLHMLLEKKLHAELSEVPQDIAAQLLQEVREEKLVDATVATALLHEAVASAISHDRELAMAKAELARVKDGEHKLKAEHAEALTKLKMAAALKLETEQGSVLLQQVPKRESSHSRTELWCDITAFTLALSTKLCIAADDIAGVRVCTTEQGAAAGSKG